MFEADIFYIIVTVVFVVFLALVLWWLFRFIHKKSILDIKREDLSDDQKQLIYNFCSEMRLKRESSESKTKEKGGKEEGPPQQQINPNQTTNAKKPDKPRKKLL